MTDSQRQRLDAIDGRATEIARYTISSGDRVLLARRVAAGVEITDSPASGSGRRYRVDRGLHGADAIAALVNDYLDQAALLDACPMDGAAISSVLCPSDQEELTSLFLTGAL